MRPGLAHTDAKAAFQSAPGLIGLKLVTVFQASDSGGGYDLFPASGEGGEDFSGGLAKKEFLPNFKIFHIYHICAKAAIGEKTHGLIDNWLRPIKDIYRRRYEELALIEDESQRADRLCELNVIEQAINLGHTTVVQEAWRRGQSLAIHGWAYKISNGLLQDSGVCLSDAEELKTV